MNDEPPLALERRPRPGAQLEVTIARIDARGVGEADLALLLGPDRCARRYRVKVRHALPGERVIARVDRVRRGVMKATLVQRTLRSDLRIAPRCIHFGPVSLRPPSTTGGEDPPRGCGGCTLQSLSYAEQLRAKQRIVTGALTRAGVDEACIRPIIGLDQPWYYRNKMEYSFARTRELPFALGLHPPGYRHEVVPLEECHLLSPAASQLVPRVARWAERAGLRPYQHRADSGFLRTLTVREGKRTGERMAIVTTADVDEVQTARGVRDAREVMLEMSAALVDIARSIDSALTSVVWTRHHAVAGEPTQLLDEPLHGPAALREELRLSTGDALRFEIHPRAFFQPNTLQAERLYVEALQAAGVLERSVPLALDLYCGTGTIALCLAPHCERVVGVELSSAAVENARRNALFNDLTNVSFIAGDVGKALATGAASSRPDRESSVAVDRHEAALAIVDPPRSGLMPQALSHIKRIAAPRLVYVSCNPLALARDLVELRDARYRVLSVQPIDMFPQTAHVESVASLAAD